MMCQKMIQKEKQEAEITKELIIKTHKSTQSDNAMAKYENRPKYNNLQNI